MRTILKEAEDICTGERAQTHGDFADVCNRTASIYNAWTSKDINALDVCKLLYCLKMAREHHNPMYRDNYVDQAGYLYLRYALQQYDLQKHSKDLPQDPVEPVVDAFKQVKEDQYYKMFCEATAENSFKDLPLYEWTNLTGKELGDLNK